MPSKTVYLVLSKEWRNSYTGDWRDEEELLSCEVLGEIYEDVEAANEAAREEFLDRTGLRDRLDDDEDDEIGSEEEDWPLEHMDKEIDRNGAISLMCRLDCDSVHEADKLAVEVIGRQFYEKEKRNKKYAPTNNGKEVVVEEDDDESDTDNSGIVAISPPSFNAAADATKAKKRDRVEDAEDHESSSSKKQNVGEDAAS